MLASICTLSLDACTFTLYVYASHSKAIKINSQQSFNSIISQHWKFDSTPTFTCTIPVFDNSAILALNMSTMDQSHELIAGTKPSSHHSCPH